MLNNILYLNYDKLKPKQKKLERTFSYHSQLLTQLGQILRIDEFNEKLDLNLDVALNIKLTEGVVGITKENDVFYLVYAIAPVGLPRKDGRPYKVNGTYIDENQNVKTKEFINDENIVLWYNNALATSETFIDFISYMLTETDVSMEYNIQRSRFNPYIKVRTEKQKKQFEESMKATHDGVPVVFVDGEDNIFSSDENLTVDVNNAEQITKIQYLSHFYDDLLKRYSNLYGFSLNMSSKQAQQTEKEISGMDSLSWLIPCDMLNQAKEFCERFKKLYDVELTAHFGIVHEFNFMKYTQDCTSDDETMNEDIDKVDNPEEKKEGVENVDN